MKNIAYKYRLLPNEEQKEDLDRRFAIAYKCWNFYLDAWNNKVHKEAKPSEKYKLVRVMYNEYLQRDENKWQQVQNKRYQEFIVKHFKESWSNYFKALKNGDVGRAQRKYKAKFESRKKAGCPMKWKDHVYDNFYKPKFKGFDDKHSFSTDFNGGSDIDIKNGFVWVHKKEKPIRFKIKQGDKILSNWDIHKIGSLTFSKTKDGKYYVSIAVEVSDKMQREYSEDLGAVGIDLGVKDYAILSNGDKINMPVEEMKRIDHRIKKLQEKLSKSYEANKNNPLWAGGKKGCNYLKIKAKIAKLHKRKADIRSNATHMFTHEVTSKYSVIGIEKLSGMVGKAKMKVGEDGKPTKNMKPQRAGMNRNILSNNFHETARQLKYKSEWRGRALVQADRFFPSTKTCSSCGEKAELSLSDRKWTCKSCGEVHDRDINAAINLRNYAIQEATNAPV
jgi:transposase